jgi:hypothetical protein
MQRLALLLALCSVAGVQAAFYVAPEGDDTNPGSAERPFATLVRARDAVRTLRQAGPLPEGPVYVYLKEGIHQLAEPLALGPEDSGSAEHPLVFAAAPGETPVVSGGQVLTGWQREGEAYVVELPEAKDGTWNPRQLFVRRPGQAWFERRYRPARGLFVIAGLTDAPYRNPNAPINHRNPQDEFMFYEGDIVNFANLPDVELVAMHDWSSGRLHIREIDFAERIVRFTTFPHYRIGHWYEGGRNPYLIENVKEDFGRPGEWYLDRPTGRLAYTPLPDEDFAACTVVAPRLERLVVATGADAEHMVEHVHFQGIVFAHSAWQKAPHLYALDYGRQCRQGFVDMPSAVEFKWARNCRVEDCTLANLGSYALDFTDGCQGNVAVGNLMYDLGTGGVKVGTVQRNAEPPLLPTGNVIDNNLIHDAGLVHYSGHGIWGGMCAQTSIRHNVVTRTLYSAVAVGWDHSQTPTGCRENAIEYNHVYDVLLLLDHGGALYTLGNQPGTTLRGNLVHDTYHTKLHGEHKRPIWAGGGLAFDDGSSGFAVEQNIIYNRPVPADHALRAGRSDDMSMVRDNVCDIKPGEPGFPNEWAARAGLEPAYRQLQDRPFRVNPPQVLAMKLPEGLKPVPIIDSYDRIPVGQAPRRAHIRLDDKEPGKGRAAVVVTDETAADGAQSLKIQDAEGLSREWIPYVSYAPSYQGGLAVAEYALRVEDRTHLECVWRGAAEGREFSVGPGFTIREGGLFVGEERQTVIPAGQWLRFRVSARLGEPDPGIGAAGLAEHGVWQLAVSLADGTPILAKTFPIAQKDFKDLRQVMFISLAQESTTCYLDSIHIRNE